MKTTTTKYLLILLVALFSCKKDYANHNEPTQSTANRFSQFAPDPHLSADDFRAQLKENMKADLERRREQDPNRGNQPAKSYLDGL